LAATEACRNQAFQLSDRTIGLQFHVEATEQSVQALVDHAGGDLTGGPFQQTAAQILSDAPAHSEATWPLLVAVLDYLADRARP
jgi:GMP synthase-like glutamine amidotransferase